MKRKRSKASHSDWMVVLGVSFLIFGLFTWWLTNNALGDEDNRNKGKSNGISREEDDTVQSDISITIAPTVLPTVMPDFQTQTQTVVAPAEVPVTITPYVMVVTPVPDRTAQPSSQPANIQITQTPQTSQPVVSQPSMTTFPISDRSVISSPGTGARAVTGPASILQTIKQGIDSISKGRIVQPTVTPIPIPTPLPVEMKASEALLKKIKLKYEIEGGQVSLVAEDEKGTRLAMGEGDLRLIESSVLNRLEKKGVFLSLTGDGMLAISNNKITAVTNLPVLVDVETRSLVVSTPDGLVPVAVLPDVALKNVIDLGAMADVNTKEVPQLEYLQGELVYKFSGTRVYKMLGRFEVTVPLTIWVSAKDGEIVSRDQPMITRAVRLISS